jgi:hypothetical protein
MSEVGTPTAQHALEACERVLRPIVRLALERGLKYQDIDAVIRTLMMDEATRDHHARTGKRPSGSQLSVTTGINRKEVKRLTGEAEMADEKPAHEQSLASMVFMAWRVQADKDVSRQVLPITSTDSTVLSFERLASNTVKDVHPRSLLDELVRLRLVSRENGLVRLIAKNFVPPGTSVELLELFSANADAHLAAAVSNLTGRANPFLEQSIWANGFGVEQCEEIQEIARDCWQNVRAVLRPKFLSEYEQGESSTPFQLRVGMYTYFEPVNKSGES